MVKKLIIASLLPLSGLWAQGLSLTLGNPIAGQNYGMKTIAMFVFRINGCADLSAAQVKAVGEGIVNNERRSQTLRPIPDPKPGVFALGRQWSRGEKWVVALTVTCGNETTAAIVPVKDDSFVRESAQLLSRAPRSAEIESALKAYKLPQ